MVTRAGAASTLLRRLLAGPGTSGRVVAVFPSCAYADVLGQLVAVEAHDAHRLPCAVVLAEPTSERPLRGVARGDLVVLATTDRSSLRLGSLRVEVGRWWAPARPRDSAEGLVGQQSPQAANHASEDWDSLVLGLLGAGPGLTPAGDDVLAGLLLGLVGHPVLHDPLAAAVLRHAAIRTTWLSAELLRHAAAGYGTPAAVSVADAVAGHGTCSLETAVARLLTVGHTSGRALTQGLLLAAETIAGRSVKPIDHSEGVAA